jgi:hypothetical protein
MLQGTCRASAALLFGIVVTTNAFAARYFIDESTDFTGNGCQNEDLNTITSSLRSRLDANGWTGSRFTNGSAYPQDFVENCSSSFGAGGLDNAFSDGAVLSVYAGHGNVGAVQFGFARNNVCVVDMDGTFDMNGSGMMRLGQMSGAQAGFGVWLTSCTLRNGTLPSNANFQWLRQQFGYHNSPSIGDNTPREWYDDIDPKSNKQAWLDAMEDKPGLFTGDNSPMVVSYGSTSANCTSTHNSTMLKRQILQPRGGGPSCGGGLPAFFWCATLRDNGTSSGCFSD